MAKNTYPDNPLSAHAQKALDLCLGPRITEAPKIPEVLLKDMYPSRSDHRTEVSHFFSKELALGRLQGDPCLLKQG